MDAITLTFDAKTLDYVCNALSRCAWVEANPILVSIQQQVNAQQRPTEPILQSGNGAAAPEGLPAH